LLQSTPPKSGFPRVAAGLVFGLALLFAQAAGATEFRSVGDAGAVFFDAPSTQATKLFFAHPYYPVAVVVNLELWCKVRDSSGDFAWVEKRALSEQRTVIVTAPVAEVRSAPDAAAPEVFEVGKDVALELLELTDAGWARVKHAEGQTGYVRADEVWGL
jgi:SH3-like domain-containing protein